MKTISKNDFLIFRIWFTSVVFVVLFALLLWQHFNGGIPSHHFLARKSMPLVSNAWGGVVIPLFTWLMLWLINRRLFLSQVVQIPFPKHVFVAFIGSLIYGIVLGISIHVGFKEISSNTPWLLIITAFLFPVYRAEYFLGFVLGLTYWVGGLLPIVIGSIFLVVTFVIYNYVRNPILSQIKRIRR